MRNLFLVALAVASLAACAPTAPQLADIQNACAADSTAFAVAQTVGAVVPGAAPAAAVDATLVHPVVSDVCAAAAKMTPVPAPAPTPAPTVVAPAPAAAPAK